MAGPNFHETQMGRAFFEGTMPKIRKALERIANALEENHEILEKDAVQRVRDLEDEYESLGT